MADRQQVSYGSIASSPDADQAYLSQRQLPVCKRPLFTPAGALIPQPDRLPLNPTLKPPGTS